MKSTEEITAEVVSIISKALNTNPESINSSDTIEGLSNDSIQLFELLLAFEKNYEVEVSYEEVAALNRVSDIVDYIKKVKYQM